MANLYYGGGDCSVTGNVASIEIIYKGAIIISSKLPPNYTIELENGKIIIDVLSKGLENGKIIIDVLSNRIYLSDLFSYMGKFQVMSAISYNLQKEKEYIKINPLLDYPKYMQTKPDDLTIKPNDLNRGYIHKRTFRKTRVLPSKIPNSKGGND